MGWKGSDSGANFGGIFMKQTGWGKLSWEMGSTGDNMQYEEY